MGLIGNVLQGLCAGTGLVLMSPFAFLKRPARWLEAISHFRASTSGGPNFAYELCARRITDEECAALDLSSWEVAYCGAEPIREATYRRFLERFGPRGFSRSTFYPCYGLAEATLFVTGNRRGTAPRSCAFDAAALDRGEVVVDGARTLISCGVPSPSEEVRIVDPVTSTVTTGVGEIWVRGPGVAAGYWGRDSDDVFAARLASGDGPFLRTGDLGFLHGGELFIAGRHKDMIILAGRNLFPQDLEAAIEAAVPAVRKGCCAAFSVERDGEERLCIMAEHDGSPEPETIREIKRALAEHAPVFDVVLVGKGGVFKTSSGKLERHACRRAYLDRQE
jgi:acyl-CoA synthetase (AMP-forming)/AMP-acid ligase II